MEVDIQFNGDENSFAEIFMAELAEVGCESFTENEGGLKAYVQIEQYDENEIVAVHEKYKELAGSTLKIEKAESKNWNEEWEKNYFTPILIGDSCRIRSSFHKVEDQLEYDIVIDPRMSFGTGHHATTHQVAQYLLDNSPEGKTVLDMGCGTAVLAILAKMRNSAKTVGIDFDEWAYENSLDNIKLNNTNDIEILHGDASKIGAMKFDLILANINRNILLNDMHVYEGALNQGGTLVLSGFYTEDIPVLQEKAESLGLRFVKSTERNKWASMVIAKS